VQLARKERLVELLALPEHQELQAHRERLVLLVPLELQEPPVFKAILELQGHKEQADLLPELLELLVILVQLD
jgi:hypothetical protein